MHGPAGGENKETKNTKTGNASEGPIRGFIKPVAALLRSWVVPQADWLIKVAAVSKG